MKKSYPDYKEISIDDVFQRLPKKNQQTINEFISYCRKDAAENTLRKYFIKMVQIADIMEKPLTKLTLKDVLGFLSVLNTSNRGTDSRNDTRKIIKRFIKFKHKGKKEFLDIDKEIRLKRKGSNEKISKKDLITKEELELLLRAAESLKYKAFLILLYESAARPEEVTKLKWGDIDFKNNEVKLNSSKTNESRTIPLQESIIHLKRYYQEYPFPNVKDDDFIFVGINREKHLKTQVNDYLQKLSVRVCKRNINPYLFRHTRLQEIRPKLSVEAYQKIAGHSIETALAHYGHLDHEDAKKEMLSKVYHIEELTKEEKSELQRLKLDLQVLSQGFVGVIDLLKDGTKNKEKLKNFDELKEQYISLFTRQEKHKI